MGYDHAEQREIDALDAGPSSSSGSGESSIVDRDPEKMDWEDERRDTITTMPDLEADDLKLKRTHTHTLGPLKLREIDDDEPSDWWFASTAIPLIAATLAPMANLLSIAALVAYWRNVVITEDPLTRESTSYGIPDPKWCFDLNAASLVCGFTGNLFLLFNFTKRVRYIVALPATIILFYVAAGILIGITTSIAIYDAPVEGQIYSQGYWHAVLAACLYMINSMILMANMLGYFLGHYPQHFTLTDEQRNLILQTMMFFIWLGGGAGIFSTTQQWSYPDALYFCDVTILTIGFGDFYPQDDVGRGLVFPYSVGGTIILGLMVSSIHRFAGELSKDKILRKHVENRRVNTLSRAVTMDEDQNKRNELEERIRKLNGKRPSISSPLPSPDIQRDLQAAADERKVEFEGNGVPDTRNDDDDAEPKKSEDSGPSPNQFLTSAHHRGTLHRTFQMIVKPVSTIRTMTAKSQKAIIMREEKDRFDAMRDIQMNASKFKKWYALMISIMAFGILWCVGAVVFWQAEQNTQGLSYFQALYFCYVSLLTIGYGDLSPKSNSGKPFFVVWSLIAVPTMTILISDMGDTVISSIKRGTFRLGDFTVLPKEGIGHDILESHPWLKRTFNRIAEKRRMKKGLPVGPSGEEDIFRKKSIYQLAHENLSEGHLTKRLAYAIRKTADDLAHHPKKRYDFEEWVEFTRLIRFTKMDISELEHDEDVEGVVEWDWLDENSPMLSEQSESEWILDRLCESLLRLIKKNNIGLESGETSATGLSPWASFSWDQPKRANTENQKSSAGKSTAVDYKPTPSQERRQRATGADSILTFFTGERRGANSYARSDPQWSKKALERKRNQRRRSSGTARRGPFSRLQHSGATGALGGGRGGAGTKTLKSRYMTGNEQR